MTATTLGAHSTVAAGWTGFKMTTGTEAFTLRSLGRMCSIFNSLPHELRVIRASDNQVVASTTVSMSGCTPEQFKYAQLASPINLSANTDYIIVSYESGGDRIHNYTGTYLTTTPVAAVKHGVYTLDGGYTWGPAGGPGASYVPLDFKYQIDEQGLGTGLTAKYYDDRDFKAYKFTRTDPTVNFEWGNGSPSASMGADEFSVRWSGMISPRYSQTYTFHTTTDDGVRLWVDGHLIINKWMDQAPTTWSEYTVLPLEAGRLYDIRMEFYEKFGGASARLEWESPSQAREVIPQSRLYGCWKDVDLFVKDFYQAALARQPSQAELQDWTGRLAQAQGEAQLLEVARMLGVALFGLSPSSAYTARNRSDGDFVADLYRGYLQRDPDQAGWNHWLGRVSEGRGNIRQAFADSIEFVEKVRRLCGTAAAADVNGGTGYNFTSARLDPSNRTGGGGVDPYSRNYNFSIPLVSLPGRAGLDLGLALSYNSLVWTKDAAGVTFDADQGFPSPGFRLGFPVIEPRFVNPRLQVEGQPARHSYLLVTPSGARVELRETTTPGVYESADSSYLQLTEGDMTLRSADGTRLSFALLNGSFRCYQVKDRNGNYLSVAHYGDGRIDKVIDTLGRALNFRYDNNLNLQEIWQEWTRETEGGADNTPHKWATFGFGDVLELQPQFSDLAVVGEQPGAQIPVLRQVGLPDGSFYRFKYNEWGQVWKVTRYAADSLDENNQPDESHPLSSTWLDLPGAGESPGGAASVLAAPQSDCPRFTQERVWVEYGVRGQSAEVTTAYSPWSPNMASCTITPPDPTPDPTSTSDDVTVTETYETALWKRGLTKQSEVFAGGQSVRTTTLKWEHDAADTAPYPTNPRIWRTTVSDPQGNGRTTQVAYTEPADFQGSESGYYETLNVRLPKIVKECSDGNCSTVLRTAVTDYKVENLGQYVARRVLGLARRQYLYDGAESGGNLRSRVEYRYDEPNDGQDAFLAAVPTPASQHDSTNYGQSMAWRGNANRVRRYSVNQSDGAVGGYVESRFGFNVTGTVAYTKDALGHKTSLIYADSFFQNVNRTHTDPQQRLQTYAYPTTVTDPDGFRATTAYNYDMGVVTEGRTPLPDQTADLLSPLAKSYYDAAGRLVRSSSDASGGYTRVIYPAEMDLVETYTLVEAGKEARSVRVLDGAGRVRASSRYLPPLADSGTGTYSGNYSGQKFDYDELGRVVRQTNPTEVTAAWELAGGDSWVYTAQTYDWKGRPLKTTHEADGSSIEYQYGGCGCAGGQAVSTRDEVGRRRRVAYDVTGRIETAQVFTQQDKSVEFVISPTESPYSTVTTTYDALGRVREVKERDEAAGAEQLTTTEYDGYGRVWRQRLPQYEANKFTTYAYNDDDTLASVTDPRGAVAAYSYEGNNRHLVTKVKHTLSSDTLEVTFEYDAAANRKKMDDGPGWVTYEYDAASRLRKERRHFDDLDTNPRNPYELDYTYTPSGLLKTLTDPFDSSFTYEFNRAGQLREVKGSAYAGVTTYARDVQYRAWGGVKSASFGNNASQTTAYDARMRPWQYRITGGGATLREDFTYYADGRLQRITDLDDGTHDPSPLYSTLSRLYVYDHVGRVTETGGNVGGTNSPSPYRQSFGYDGFGNMTSRSGTYGYRMAQTDTSIYANNRRQGWGYNAGGQVTHSTDPNGSTQTWDYDAAGRLVTKAETAAGVTRTLTQVYDGDGRVAYSSNGSAAGTDYEVRSDVLGGEVVTRLTSTGNKRYTYVPAGGLVRPRQTYNSSNQEVMQWSHLDPVGVTESGSGLAAYDPLGNYAPLPEGPPTGQPPPPPTGQYGPIWGGVGSLSTNYNNFSSGCMAPSGSPSDCNRAMQQSMRENAGFWDNLPREYRGGEELRRAEQAYHEEQDAGFFWIPIAITDNRLGIRLPFSRSSVPGSQLGDEVKVPTLKNANTGSHGGRWLRGARTPRAGRARPSGSTPAGYSTMKK